MMPKICAKFDRGHPYPPGRQIRALSRRHRQKKISASHRRRKEIRLSRLGRICFQCLAAEKKSASRKPYSLKTYIPIWNGFRSFFSLTDVTAIPKVLQACAIDFLSVVYHLPVPDVRVLWPNAATDQGAVCHSDSRGKGNTAKREGGTIPPLRGS